MAKNKAQKQVTSQQPSTALEWRKAREVGELVPLPSGLSARLRPADLMKMVKLGKIPDLLSPLAAKVVWAEQEPGEIGDTLEMAMGYYDLISIVIPAIFVYPEIVTDEEAGLTDDQILLADVGQDDRVIAFNLAISGVSAMKQFRERQNEFMAALSDVNEDSETAV